MITLMTFNSIWGIRNASPFCYKADALLTRAGVEFERKASLPNKAPTKKLPAIMDKGECIGDSSLIQAHLEQVHGVDFDGKLDDAQKADAVAYQRLVENHLYYVGIYIRWVMFGPTTRDAFFADVPALIRPMVFKMVQRDMTKSTHFHGISRHSDEEIFNFGIRDLDALSLKLQNQPFLLGDRLTSADIAVYPFIVNTAVPPLETIVRDRCRSDSVLKAYCERCENEIYGDVKLGDW